MNAVPEQPVSPEVLTLGFRHLPRWVQQPSHMVLVLQLLPIGTILLQSTGGGGGDADAAFSTAQRASERKGAIKKPAATSQESSTKP